ncbi:MAG: alpha/beta fold hydrolase [bacterium]
MNLKTGINEYLINIKKHKIYFKCKFNPNSNEVVLFIHGLACSLDSFRNVFDEDYFPNKSLLLVDLAGFGKSSKMETFSYLMQDQALIIEELLTHLPHWNIHIAAHSMGGAIALLMLPNILSRVLSFSNIEGNLVSEDCGALSRGISSISYEKYKNDLFPKQLIEFEGHQQLRFEETTPFAVYNSAKSLVEWSDNGKLFNMYKNLKCKKCYFYGQENKDMPILNKLNFVQKYIINNSGHGMMTENPKEFYSNLKKFINQ